MASIQWHKTTSIIDSLKQEPYAFSFNQAVFILRHAGGNLAGANQTAHTHAQSDAMPIGSVKFKAHVTMATQASSIFKLDFKNGQPILWLNFLSLAGASGPLPLSYTENILDGLRRKDTAIPDFLDIFNNRLAAL